MQAFRASRLASLDSGKGPGTAATYGLKRTESFAQYDPGTHSLRTFQGSLFTPTCAEYSVTLPKHGMTWRGAYWALTMWGQITAENGSGFWPTIRAADSERGTQGDLLAWIRGYENKHWPTPNVPNGGRTVWHAEQEGNSYYHAGKKVQLELEQAVRMYPTPQAKEGGYNQGGGNGREGQPIRPTLQMMARHAMWATPNHVGGQLNPLWVEWLMGWPLGWTDLKPLEMGKCPCVLLWLGTCSSPVSTEESKT